MTQTVAVKGGLLIDGNGGPPVSDPVVLIEDGRITAVGNGRGVKIPKNAAVVDAKKWVLMPGLMDLHLHLGAANVAFCQDTDLEQITRSRAEMLLYAVRHARMLLEAGFTTVRDLDYVTPEGHVNAFIVALRNAIAADILTGPRLIVGGMVHVTGSHFDFLPRSMPRPPDFTADGPAEFRKLTRKTLRNGVDFLKTCISGGTGTYFSEDYRSRNITQEELSVLVDEAHAFGKLVAAHCHTPDSIRMALDAGVDTIEHCVFVDDDVIERVLKAGAYIVPTLAFRQKRVIDSRRARGIPEFVLTRMEQYRVVCNESFKRYHKAGVQFAMGTDTHVDPPFGQNAYELEIYVDLGLSEMEAIQTATKNAADAIGRSKDLGTLESGKWGDLLAVDGNPLEDITVLQKQERIKLVIKEGRVVVDRRNA